MARGYSTEEALKHLFHYKWENLKDTIKAKLYVVRSRYLNNGSLSNDKKEEALRDAGFKLVSDKVWSEDS